jgi:hypothetical protein
MQRVCRAGAELGLNLPTWYIWAGRELLAGTSVDERRLSLEVVVANTDSQNSIRYSGASHISGSVSGRSSIDVTVCERNNTDMLRWSIEVIVCERSGMDMLYHVKIAGQGPFELGKCRMWPQESCHKDPSKCPGLQVVQFSELKRHIVL